MGVGVVDLEAIPSPLFAPPGDISLPVLPPWLGPPGVVLLFCPGVELLLFPGDPGLYGDALLDPSVLPGLGPLFETDVVGGGF